MLDEPVALAHIEETETYLDVQLQVLDGEHLQPGDSPVPLYLRPSFTSELVAALTDLVLYHDVPAEAQDPVVLPLLRAALAAIAKAEGWS